MSVLLLQRRLYTVKDAAVYLGRSPWCVAELLRTGRLPYIPEGRRRYLDVKDLDTFIERSKVTDDAD